MVSRICVWICCSRWKILPFLYINFLTRKTQEHVCTQLPLYLYCIIRCFMFYLTNFDIMGACYNFVCAEGQRIIGYECWFSVTWWWWVLYRLNLQYVVYTNLYFSLLKAVLDFWEWRTCGRLGPQGESVLVNVFKPKRWSCMTHTRTPFIPRL